jgi:DNA-binding LacI/PurR family transcriptional regulator
VSGETSAAQRLPTLEDVAQVAGVSRATVSRVINGIRNVNPELHAVVWNAVEQTGYVPNRAARSLVTRRNGTVALVVSDSESHEDDPFMSRFFSDPFFGRVVGGLMSALRPVGVQLALQLVGSHDARTRLVGDLRQGQADGSVVLSLHPGDTLPQLLAEARLPTIMIGRPASPLPISYVDVANDAGAALAAARAAEQRAAVAEQRQRELAALVCGEPRLLTPSELATLRDGGPSGPVVLASALKRLARARSGADPGTLDGALADVASAAVRWRDRL